jgi:hypothetical protein
VRNGIDILFGRRVGVFMLKLTLRILSSLSGKHQWTNDIAYSNRAYLRTPLQARIRASPIAATDAPVNATKLLSIPFSN